MTFSPAGLAASTGLQVVESAGTVAIRTPLSPNDAPVRRSRAGPGPAGLVATASTLFDSLSAIVDRFERRLALDKATVIIDFVKNVGLNTRFTYSSYFDFVTPPNQQNACLTGLRLTTVSRERDSTLPGLSRAILACN